MNSFDRITQQVDSESSNRNTKEQNIQQVKNIEKMVPGEVLAHVKELELKAKQLEDAATNNVNEFTAKTAKMLATGEQHALETARDGFMGGLKDAREALMLKLHAVTGDITKEEFLLLAKAYASRDPSDTSGILEYTFRGKIDTIDLSAFPQLKEALMSTATAAQEMHEAWVQEQQQNSDRHKEQARIEKNFAELLDEKNYSELTVTELADIAATGTAAEQEKAMEMLNNLKEAFKSPAGIEQAFNDGALTASSDREQMKQLARIPRIIDDVIRAQKERVEATNGWYEDNKERIADALVDMPPVNKDRYLDLELEKAKKMGNVENLDKEKLILLIQADALDKNRVTITNTLLANLNIEMNETDYRNVAAANYVAAAKVLSPYELTTEIKPGYTLNMRIPMERVMSTVGSAWLKKNEKQIYEYVTGQNDSVERQRALQDIIEKAHIFGINNLTIESLNELVSTVWTQNIGSRAQSQIEKAVSSDDPKPLIKNLVNSITKEAQKLGIEVDLDSVRNTIRTEAIKAARRQADAQEEAARKQRERDERRRNYATQQKLDQITSLTG